jgi:hypothetical protein
MATKSDMTSGAAATSLMQLATAFKGSRAIYVATDLGIPDTYLLPERKAAPNSQPPPRLIPRLSVG